MKLKDKIALSTIKRKLERQSITLEQAMDEFEKVTGLDADDYFECDDAQGVTLAVDPEEKVTDPEVTGQKKEESDPETEQVTESQLTEPNPEGEPDQMTEQVTESQSADLNPESQPDQTTEQVTESQPTGLNPERVDTVRTRKKKEAQQGQA